MDLYQALGSASFPLKGKADREGPEAGKAEFRDMKMQPSIERALSARRFLKCSDGH